jgi:hypothetical protein
MIRKPLKGLSGGGGSSSLSAALTNGGNRAALKRKMKETEKMVSQELMKQKPYKELNSQKNKYDESI